MATHYRNKLTIKSVQLPVMMMLRKAHHTLFNYLQSAKVQLPFFFFLNKCSLFCKCVLNRGPTATCRSSCGCGGCGTYLTTFLVLYNGFLGNVAKQINSISTVGYYFCSTAFAKQSCSVHIRPLKTSKPLLAQTSLYTRCVVVAWQWIGSLL